ncbi:MAG: tRNA glutamyl-Q(34) synthetase GluQRS [Muribaculaceae bacterium]|nr:tRNA glutamyl-Q(34) synthetase GluQRS [Muribaculaceae bacterium]
MKTDDKIITKSPTTVVKGRFAPSPTGRMHLGNVFAALISWLSVKKQDGKWVLRIEDLDPQRSRLEYARLIEDDLHWLGLDWDEGGLDDSGPNPPYRQSLSGEIYEEALRKLKETGLTYPCYCTRADIMATQAPHESDGRVVYSGKCRPLELGGMLTTPPEGKSERATRLIVPDETIHFTDRLYGPQAVNLAEHCGDFILRRADGAWAYQLAVVVDDARMGITEVVRGSDLLLSSAQQIYLYRLLGLPVPEFAHVPLICNDAGQRLSKRDRSMSMEEVRKVAEPSHVIGQLAHLAGLLPAPFPISAQGLLHLFSWSAIPKLSKII